MWGGSITGWLWFREMSAGVLAGRDHPVSQPGSHHHTASQHQSTVWSYDDLNLYNPPVKSTGKYYKLTISDVDYHHQRSGHKESHKAISFWYKTHCCVASSRWTTSHQIFEKYFSTFAPQIFSALDLQILCERGKWFLIKASSACFVRARRQSSRSPGPGMETITARFSSVR